MRNAPPRLGRAFYHRGVRFVTVSERGSEHGFSCTIVWALAAFHCSYASFYEDVQRHNSLFAYSQNALSA